MNPFHDPTKDLPKPQVVRTSIYFDNAILLHLRGLRCRKGTVQTTLGILLQKLKLALDNAGIKSFTDPATYERAILGCRIVIAADAAAGSTTKRRRTRSAPAVASTGQQSPVPGEATIADD